MKRSTSDRRGSAHARQGRAGSPASPRPTTGSTPAGGRGSSGTAGRGTSASNRTNIGGTAPGAGSGAGRRAGRQRPTESSEDVRRSEAHRSEVYSRVRLRSPDGPLRARVDPLHDLPAQRRDDRTAMGLPARGRLSRFFADMGWRAYAIPLLIIATMLVLVDFTKSDAGSSGGPSASDTSGTTPDPGPSVFVDAPTAPEPTVSGGTTVRPTAPANLPSYALPNGPPYTQSGKGEFDVVSGVSQMYGTGGPLKTFTVEIEEGITGIDPQQFAKQVESVLGDPRGWSHGGQMRFQRVDSGDVDFRISLTTPMTVRQPTYCGYDIKAETSCYNRRLDRVLINVSRWVRGAVAYGRDLQGYRQYAITHETGHALGRGHEACPKAGVLAPPMMQQTLGVTSVNGLTCRPNPWPFATGDTEITGPDTTAPPKLN